MAAAERWVERISFGGKKSRSCRGQAVWGTWGTGEGRWGS